jgi:beta-ribofuranosylaminobenzene 5'-phosphate synthase
MGVIIRTPARLHFGLLAYTRDGARQFGGAGLMVKWPETVVTVRELTEPGLIDAVGRLGDKAGEYARRTIDTLVELYKLPRLGVRIDVTRVARPHTGLGSGTQLAMAVGRGVCAIYGQKGHSVPTPGPEMLARLTGRGKRSGIGVHGFFQGGFLVDGGKTREESLSPMVIRQAFPEDWRIVLIRPRSLDGLAGQRELEAFKQMPDFPAAVTDQMCRLVLMGLAPGIAERDIQHFGASLFELQQLAGQCYASAQGGVYASPLLEEIVGFIRGQGIQGVGQSSWGPSLYAVVADEDRADALASQIEKQFGLGGRGEVVVTSADNNGSTMTPVESRIYGA